MTTQEALALIERIKREEGGRVKATLTPTTNRGPKKTAVRLNLIPGQRVVTIVRPDEWESVQEVWREIV